MELLNCDHKYTINPITGRKICVGGKVFIRLLLDLGYEYDLKKNILKKEEFDEEEFDENDSDDIKVYYYDDIDEFNCEFYDSIYGSEFL